MLEFHTLKDQEAAGGPLIADRRLLLTADEATVVEEDDPRASFLLCGAGGTISPRETKRLGLRLVDGRVVQGAPEADEPKEQKPAENKETKPAENKSGKSKPFFGSRKG